MIRTEPSSFVYEHDKNTHGELLKCVKDDYALLNAVISKESVDHFVD